MKPFVGKDRAILQKNQLFGATLTQLKHSTQGENGAKEKCGERKVGLLHQASDVAEG